MLYTLFYGSKAKKLTKLSFAPHPDVPRVRPLPFPLQIVVVRPRVLGPHRVLDQVPLVQLYRLPSSSCSEVVM